MSGGGDRLQELLEQEYQKLNSRVGTHYHECHACGVTLVCCCPDRRGVDRGSGSKRLFWCVRCWEIKMGMEELAVEDIT